MALPALFTQTSREERVAALSVVLLGRFAGEGKVPWGVSRELLMCGRGRRSLPCLPLGFFSEEDVYRWWRYPFSPLFGSKDVTCVILIRLYVTCYSLYPPYIRSYRVVYLSIHLCILQYIIIYTC